VEGAAVRVAAGGLSVSGFVGVGVVLRVSVVGRIVGASASGAGRLSARVRSHACVPIMRACVHVKAATKFDSQVSRLSQRWARAGTALQPKPFSLVALPLYVTSRDVAQHHSASSKGIPCGRGNPWLPLRG
jgi:hypothetical protein